MRDQENMVDITKSNIPNHCVSAHKAKEDLVLLYLTCISTFLTFKIHIPIMELLKPVLYHPITSGSSTHMLC